MLVLLNEIGDFSSVKFFVRVHEIKVDIWRGTLSGKLRVPNDGILKVALLVIRIIDIGHTEACIVSVLPFEVVHQRPSEVTFKVYTIHSDGIN